MNGLSKPSISNSGVSFPSSKITKEPFLGFSGLIITGIPATVNASLTLDARVLNAFLFHECVRNK